MTADATETIACPFCAGEIRRAARLCKHCKRLLDDSGAAANTAGPPMNPAVLGELRAFVVARGVVRPEQFDARVAQHPGVDAAVMLGHLAAAGYITAVQVESLREGFRQQQESRAVAMLSAAQDRGLLTPSHVEQALAGFHGVIFQQTVGEYLTSAGLLTAAQVESFATPADRRGARPAAAGSRRKWVIGGAVAAALAVVVLAVVVFGSRDTLTPRCRYSAADLSWGLGACTFTNTTSETIDSCGQAAVRCFSGEPMLSEPVCTGPLAPGLTRTVSVHSNALARFQNTLSSMEQMRENCSFYWVPGPGPAPSRRRRR